MKRLSIISLATALSCSAFAADDMNSLKAELEQLKSQVAELKKNQESADLSSLAKQVKELKVRTGGDNIKWDIDYRASYDYLRYKMNGAAPYSSASMQAMMPTVVAGMVASGAAPTAGAAMTALNGMMPAMAKDAILGNQPENYSNSGLLTNRLVLGMKAAPTKNLSFIGKLSMNKAFGDTANHSQSNTTPGFANFDWVTNENALDTTVHVKEAYFIYFGDMGPIPYTASVGRRPSYDGLPGNMREGNADANSPLSHLINVEYDGASFKFDLDKLTGISGMSFKLCMGKGLTNARPRFDMFGPDYSKDLTKNADVDLYGFIFVPYDDGQYSIHSMFFKANNMIGFDQSDMSAFQTAYGRYYSSNYDTLMNYYIQGAGGAASNHYQNSTGLQNLSAKAAALQFKNVGALNSGTILAMANGIGNGWSNFLDNTTAFASYAFTKTLPSSGHTMLGSGDSKFGSSWWLGVQIPAVFTAEGKIGIEYNQGSKYWRSVTYGEDTMIGSKLATRGKAWEGYYNQPLAKNLDMQLRYTYINYDYAGSNGFFGAEGTPYSMDEATAAGLNVVKSASDARAYIRYRY